MFLNSKPTVPTGITPVLSTDGTRIQRRDLSPEEIAVIKERRRQARLKAFVDKHLKE